MDLTPENKEFIDKLSLHVLFYKWRFAPHGDPWFQGETGNYWLERLTELRKKDPKKYSRLSKRLG